MRDRELKKRIRQISIPPYEEEAYKRTLELAGKMDLHPELRRMNFREFALGQIGFIRKKVWAVKLLMTGVFLFFLIAEGMRIDSEAWTLLSVMAPLLCLVGINEICDICRPGMRGILQAARYSLREMLVIRLILFGVLDLIICFTGAVIVSGMTSVLLWQALLYFIAPFGVMCWGCLAILNRCNDDSSIWYCTAWAGFLAVALSVMRNMDSFIYNGEQSLFWGAAALIGGAAAILELTRLMKKMGGKSNEIIYGTSD